MSSRRIGNYQITDYVGSGGFGSVFKAEDVNTPGRIVAIKELHKKHTRIQNQRRTRRWTRQTDLQVAIPARATVAMPPAENTAAGGLDTIKLQGADDVKTALLTVESLPAGTALFIGSRPVGSAGEDGCATLKLSPGEYEIRAATPTGGVGRRLVTVTAQDAAGLMTTTLPVTQATMTGGALASARPEQSRRGKQIAAAVVVVLLLALAAAAYFVLRGPDRTQVDSASEGALAAMRTYAWS